MFQRKMSQQSKMARTMGVNLRVTGHCSQGGRKYMEDFYEVFYQLPSAEHDLEFAYFGVFDGHGGREAADFARKHLMKHIIQQKNFWSDDDDLVLKAIKDGFIATHLAMWKEVAKWPKTVSGLPSTSGTTASIVFIRQGKMYIGHVGDSKIVLGYQDPSSDRWLSQSLTKDHKPETPKEKERIYSVGGLVMNKAGVERVVWNRPRLGHKGPVRRSTHFDQIPFLAVARSLGDLWSYNYLKGEFVVSPEPDVHVITIDPKRDRCVILASDGLWNMSSPNDAVRTVHEVDLENTRLILESEGSVPPSKAFCSPSEALVTRALKRWYNLQMRADNTSVLTVIIDPPGPPRQEVLLRQKMMLKLRPREEVETEGIDSKRIDAADTSWLKTDSSQAQPQQQQDKRSLWSSCDSTPRSFHSKPAKGGAATVSPQDCRYAKASHLPTSCDLPCQQQTKPEQQAKCPAAPLPSPPSPQTTSPTTTTTTNTSFTELKPLDVDIGSDCAAADPEISICHDEDSNDDKIHQDDSIVAPVPESIEDAAAAAAPSCECDENDDDKDTKCDVVDPRTLDGSSSRHQKVVTTQKRKVHEEEKNVGTAPPKKPCLPAWTDHTATMSSCRLVAASQDLRLGSHSTRTGLRTRKPKA